MRVDDPNKPGKGKEEVTGRMSPSTPLGEDEFRLLALMRAYADRQDQNLEPSWLGEQLEFTEDQLRAAARSLDSRGMVVFFEWHSHNPPANSSDPLPMNLRMTPTGWDYLRNGR
ncbi:MAG TPA: hypothetical protein VGI81_02785 [Tepidisphaeraceae bacterium]|jgi:2-iminoacetate synthase ThiH